MAIKKIDNDNEFEECARVIRDSFMTVAGEFNITYLSREIELHSGTKILTIFATSHIKDHCPKYGKLAKVKNVKSVKVKN